MTFFVQAHSERGDKEAERVLVACSGPEGKSESWFEVRNNNDRLRQLWTNPIQLKMRLVPGDYTLAVGQPGRIDAWCYFFVSKRLPDDN